QRTVTLPNGLSGTYYLFVETDYRNQVNEATQEGNNAKGSGPLQITRSPSPDLQVSAFTLGKERVMSDEATAIRYTVVNRGAADVLGETWTDRVYLSKEATWDIAKATKIKEIVRTQALLQNGSYQVSDSIFLPMRLLRDLGIEMMNCYFYVFADAGDALYEHAAEGNNVRSSGPVHMMHQPHADLAVTAVSGSGTAASGQSATVKWSVKNLGGVTGYYYEFWYDGVFLSRDTLLDAGDIFVTDKVITGPLGDGGTYADELTFTVPNGLSGPYYLLLVADHSDRNRDRKRGNNYRLITGANGQPAPLTVTLSPSPDLAVTAFRAPGRGTSGQPVTVAWTVENGGAGPTTKGNWTERVYLSDDPVVDETHDLVLGTFARTGDLAVGVSYTDSLEVTLPVSAVGNYYLLFKADNNNTIYEHQAEGNNTGAAVLTIDQPLPSDLVVGSIGAPATVMAGGSVEVRWTVRNAGQFPAAGRLRDGIYLSRDSLWDLKDVLLASEQYNLNLAPLAAAERTAQVKVAGVELDEYFVLVHTDLLNNVFERNDTNNVAASASKVKVSVPELPVGQAVTTQLANQQALYYRIEVPASLENQTLLVTLAGAANGAGNELYLRYGNVPSRAVSVFSYGTAVAGSQEIIVPALRTGTYYLMAYGASTVAQSQSVQLKAEVINFELRNVAAREGGNTGAVTVKLSGAKFEPDMQVQLTDAVLGTVTAHYAEWVNTTSLFATFNLAGAKLGTYDVVLKKNNGETATLPDGFKVVAGTGGSSGVAGGGGGGGGFTCSIVNVGVEELLGTDVQHPANTRVNRVVPMTINFSNSGNVDLPIPARFLVSMRGAPVGFTAEELAEGKQELYIEFKELNGPKGVLRPGASGSITVYAMSSAPLRFKLIQ
ncbi:MAG: hypothetical protein ICV83_15020, partial [Cytophagales bacterium]|nr:hypothetical protein [Cytophagales bacterium]